MPTGQTPDTAPERGQVCEAQSGCGGASNSGKLGLAGPLTTNRWKSVNSKGLQPTSDGLQPNSDGLLEDVDSL